MAESYTGVKVLEGVDGSLIDQLYKDRTLALASLPTDTYYPNMFLVLKTMEPEKKSVLVMVSKDKQSIIAVDTSIEACEIKPKNKEQTMALNMLMDDTIPLNIITGKAGTGKTLLALATAIDKIQDSKYDKIIITRPMSQVGKRDLGALPGDVSEKIGPYLINYMSNLEQIVGSHSLQDAIEQFSIEVIPLQLMRGASFANAFIIADEVQVLDHHEMLTLGTRVGEGSKLVIMGDLNQRDEKIAKDKTGIWKIQEDPRMKQSGLVASIELLKVERSALARLFAEVFEE